MNAPCQQCGSSGTCRECRQRQFNEVLQEVRELRAFVSKLAPRIFETISDAKQLKREKVRDGLDLALRAWTGDKHAIGHGPFPGGLARCAARSEGIWCCLDEEHSGYQALLDFVSDFVSDQTVATQQPESTPIEPPPEFCGGCGAPASERALDWKLLGVWVCIDCFHKLKGRP